MVRINLLPWRDWERERKQKEFITNLVLVAVAAVLLVFGYGKVLDGDIENQQARNKYLEGEIRVLDERIATIRDLREQRQNLLERMRVIQELQGNRPVIVRVFDELVRTLANGVHYTAIAIEGQSMRLAGVAESNARISAQMRNLDGSDWFADPNLQGIQEQPSGQGSTFTMTVQRTNPGNSGSAADGADVAMAGGR